MTVRSSSLVCRLLTQQARPLTCNRLPFGLRLPVSTRTTTSEWWLSEGKSMSRQGDRLSMSARTLGVAGGPASR